MSSEVDKYLCRLQIQPRIFLLLLLLTCFTVIMQTIGCQRQTFLMQVELNDLLNFHKLQQILLNQNIYAAYGAEKQNFSSDQ